MDAARIADGTRMQHSNPGCLQSHRQGDPVVGFRDRVCRRITLGQSLDVPIFARKPETGNPRKEEPAAAVDCASVRAGVPVPIEMRLPFGITVECRGARRSPLHDP